MGILEPVGGPDAAYIPTKAFQDGLSEAIPIPGGLGGVIGGTITFDSHQITAWITGIHNRQVDKKSCNTDPGNALKTLFTQCVRYGDLEITVRSSPRLPFRLVEGSGLTEGQKIPQCKSPAMPADPVCWRIRRRCRLIPWN